MSLCDIPLEAISDSRHGPGATPNWGCRTLPTRHEKFTALQQRFATILPESHPL
jgi:hypothetical protein